MTPTKREILAALPPYEDRWITISEDQRVKDIIKEVIAAHKEFSPYYDKIALYFSDGSLQAICNKLYSFCKKNIAYNEETEDEQTSALPTGIVTRGYGDCKHYAGFCAGVLDALNRAGDDIDWSYRFASYDLLDSTPHHVFIVVNDRGRELWIDPTPGSQRQKPLWTIDKKVSTMALKRNISGTYASKPIAGGIDKNNYGSNSMGRAFLVIHPLVNADMLNYDGSGRYAGVFGPYLSLSDYRDLSGDRTINAADMATQLNNMIAQGPQPGHTITGDFVQWVYDNNIRSWNFYYPGGVKPGFSAANILPPSWPRLIITEDGRLTLSTTQALDDYRNGEIHLLTAWAQAIINAQDPSPYPVKPAHIKVHSQMLEGNEATRNLFTEARGVSIFTQVGKALEGIVNFLKEGFLTIVGSIPRNAFLSLIGLNIFHWADKMQAHINNGEWPEMAKKWEAFGGNPDKLKNTIEHGSKIPAVDDSGNQIGAAPAAAAWLAAAAPIIAILLKYLDKEGKATEIAGAFAESVNRGLFGPGVQATLGDTLELIAANGKPLQIYIPPEDNENLGGGNNDLPGSTSGGGIMQFLQSNPLIIAGGGALATYFLTKKRGQKANMILPLVVGGGLYFLLSRNGSSSASPTPGQLAAIESKLAEESQATVDLWMPTIRTMSPAEINVFYTAVVQYAGQDWPQPLRDQMAAILTKYNLHGS